MSQSVTRLKQLLFDNEAATLEDLSRRLDELAERGQANRAELLDELRRAIGEVAQSERSGRADVLARIETLAGRVGSDETLTRSVAGVIDRVLVEAEEQRHDDLAEAVAPVVIRTVRSEIRNSRDDIVEVLYPMTGQMVRAYVASAMKDLVAEVNRRLESNAFMLRLRALTTGRSVAELAIADSQRLVVEELLLVRRGSGELIARWPERPTSNHDHVLGGVLSAINSFVSEALESDENELRQIDLGQSRVYLRASPAFLLAARCGGTAAGPVERLLDDEFLKTVAALGAVPPEGASKTLGEAGELADLAARLDGGLKSTYAELNAPAGGMSPLKLLALLIGVPLALWIAWTAYVDYATDRVTAVASEIIRTSPEIRGYPTRLTVAPRGKSIVVTGLAPSHAAQSAVAARLRAALPQTAIDDQIAVLPGGPPDARPEVARLEQQIARLEADVPRQIALRAAERASDSLTSAASELDRLGALSKNGPEPVRAAIGAAKEATQAAGVVAESSRRALAAGPPEAGAAPLQNALDAAAGKVAAAAGRLAALAGAASAPTRSASGQAAAALQAGAADYGHSAERLAAEAQRMAVLATALTHAALTRAAIPPPSVTVPTPREELARYVSAHAIFFGEETALRDPAAAGEHLDRIAGLMLASDAFLRVVGYTDGRGTASRNSSLSLQRATVVFNALRERGVPAGRMVVLGRESTLDISPDNGPQSANRRVELEIGFDGEGGR